jgi:uncharacterized Tic20 family protein
MILLKILVTQVILFFLSMLLLHPDSPAISFIEKKSLNYGKIVALTAIIQMILILVVLLIVVWIAK